MGEMEVANRVNGLQLGNPTVVPMRARIDPLRWVVSKGWEMGIDCLNIKPWILLKKRISFHH